jgi:hypothetical protein
VLYQYNVWSLTIINLASITWTQTLTYCPTITYQIKDSDTSSIVDLTMYSVVGNILKLSSSDVTKTRMYNI